VDRLATDIDDWDWRFRRDPCDVAPNKLIEHHIAEHDDFPIAHCVEEFSGALFG
jgi:hypothetical protein